MASKFQQSLQMLQELKASHQTLDTQKQKAVKELGAAKERHDSQSKELKVELHKKYQSDIKEFQQSFMERFSERGPTTMESRGQTI
jgi:hypothetical protein